MKLYIKYIVFFLLSINLNVCGQDYIFELLDSLENNRNLVYKKTSFTTNLNFKAGEIPVYKDEEYLSRINDLNSYSPFKFTYNSVVRKYIDRYVRNPKTVSYIVQKTQFYFPLFERYLNHFQIPLELKNLAIVESALNPLGKSHCGAAGLWQFMYGTGKAYHLEINSLVDERYDIEKETIAACLYLKDLFKIYNDWPLAIAAYNCGPGNVNKAIKKAGGNKDFWAIYDFLPKETQGYVPAFIAATYITKYYPLHNIKPIDNENFFDESNFILINDKTTIKALSVKLKIDYNKLKYLNPQYFTDMIPGFGNKLILPAKIVLKETQTEFDFVVFNEKKSTKQEDSLPSGNINQKEVNNKEVKIKKHTSTIFNINSDTPIQNQSLYSNYLSKINNSITVFGEAPEPLYIKNGDIVELYNKYAFYINNQYVVENSKLLTKVTFSNNSIVLSVFKIVAFNKTLNVSIQGEILEKPGKSYLLENNNIIILKS